MTFVSINVLYVYRVFAEKNQLGFLYVIVTILFLRCHICLYTKT